MADVAGVLLNIGSGPAVTPGWISIDGSWQARFAGHPMAARVVSLLTGREVGHWPAGIRCLDVRRGLPFPDVQNGRWQVSYAGGGHPAWSAAGRELFYVGANGHLIAVPV